MVRIADYEQSPQAACDGPRFRVVQGMDVSVEDGFSAVSLEELKRRGHRIVTVDDYNEFGWRPDDLEARRARATRPPAICAATASSRFLEDNQGEN